MIEIERFKKGRWLKLTVSGHADYAQRGKDIVCAGISVLCMALIERLYALEKKGKLRALDIEFGDGYYRCSFNDGRERLGNEALALVCRGMELVSENYPDYVGIKEYGCR